MPATAKDRALRLLAVRSRSRQELRRRLRRAGYEPPEIESAVADLERAGLVDDRRFAEDLAAEKLRRRGYGPRAALTALRQAGVAPEVAERAVEAAGLDDEEARAEEVARGRVPRLAGLAPEVAYRRLLGFLLRRGFDPEAARTACNRALSGEPGEEPVADA